MTRGSTGRPRFLVLRSLQPRIAELGANVEIDEAVANVLGDHTLIQQILLNLIENALTYSRPGIPPYVRRSCKVASHEVVISVRDEGVGIAPEHFGAIFGVFQRLHNQDEYPGTGIGLATVELLRGRVWLESVVGQGSTFSVALLAIQPPSPNAQSRTFG